MKLGKAFSDSLITEGKSATRFGKPRASRWWLGAGRALLFASILFIALFVLGWRLFELTVIRGHEFRALADGNRTRELVRHAPRGKILDRTGKVLADNTPMYRLILPCDTSDPRPCTKTLNQSERDALIVDGMPTGRYMENDFTRVYPEGAATSHVLGYTGEITAEELEDIYYGLRGYRAGDRIGRMGAEAAFEERLRGRDGREFVEINASGTVTRTLGMVEEVPGEDVTLAVDRGMAQAAAAAFPPDKKGAIVVSRPKTGEVLTMYASPSFDANVFSSALSNQTYNRLFEDPDQPMFNRGIGGVYPPGSTFKIVTAIAALEEGSITPATLVEDVGELDIGAFRFPNWYFTQYGKTEGLVDIIKALQRSNDIYFYKAGEEVGITKISAWARKVGVGTPLGIETPGEAAGLMPDPAWKAQHFGSRADRQARNDQWYLGDTYHVSIGQGYLLTSPLQVNTWTNVVANGGNVCIPTIEKREQKCKAVGIRKKTIDIVTEGMKRACEPGGTGWPLFNFSITRQVSRIMQENTTNQNMIPDTLTPDTLSIPVACKTGTAEFGDPDNKTHAWFTAFAPLRQGFAGQTPLQKSDVLTGEPEISVTVLVEGAGEGSTVAAPIAKKIFEEWFSR